MQNSYTSDPNSEESNINLKTILEKYLSYWKWFLGSVFLCLILATLYLRYSVPVYSASTSLLIKDDQSGNFASELSAFEDIGLFSGKKNVIDDEIEILKSRSIAENTVKAGDFNTTYITEGRIKSSDAYGINPIKVNFLNKDDRFYKIDTLFTIDVKSPNRFEILDQENVSQGEFNFNQIINSKDLGPFQVVKNIVLNKKSERVPLTNGKTIVGLTNLQSCAESYKARINVATLSKFSNIVALSINDEVPAKAKDYLDKLVEIYNEDAINDKNLISEKTAKFINDRLGIITTELDGVERQAENYKKSKNITDIPAEAELNLRSNEEYTAEGVSVTAQLNVVEMMIGYLKSSKEEIIPSNIISDDTGSAVLIGEYNNLVIERNRILKSSMPDNPIVVRLTDKINALRGNINESLSKLKSTLQAKSSGVISQKGNIQGKISQLPQIEREYRGIFRQQQIKEELYLYLFKKREETAISLAATAPNSKVVDKAFSSNVPVTPKRGLVYLMSFLLGLLIPFAIIYLIDLLDTKVKNRQDVDKLGIPFIGDVPHSDSNNELIRPDSRTSSAEAIRIVRTNLEFILNNSASDKAKTVFMTSTLPGEGKTFIAVNLAATIAISGRKVLLIGMDIRNPKLDEYLHLPSHGVTNFLSSNDKSIRNYIVNQKGYEHFDILPAGIIPPNPAELLMGKKVAEMFAELKDLYDYIIVDTAPVSLVTDTLLISQFADAFIYVVRANYLDKSMLKAPETLYREKKLPNMSLLLNDTDVSKGYGYGYGYVESSKVKKPWYKKILSHLPFVS